MTNYSSSSPTTTPISSPTCDSWGVMRFVSVGGSVGPITLAHSGISTATRISSGLFQVEFKNPVNYRSGAYFVAITPEILNDDVPNCYLNVDRNLSADRFSPRKENNEFFRFINIAPVSGVAPGNFMVGDPLTSYGVNCAVFCFATTGATGTTGAGITLEASYRNLLTYSTQVGGGNWINSNTTTTTNAAVAPDFTKTASLVTNDSANPGNGYVYKSWNDGISFDGTPRTFTASVYAKAANIDGATSEAVYLYIRTGLKASYYNFQVVGNGSASSSLNYNAGSVGTEVHSGHRMRIEKAGNGWYRCSMTLTITNLVDTSVTALGFFPSGGLSGFTTGSGIYLWGAQLEEGSVLNKFIPTSSTAVVGNQEERRSLVPGSRGFGASGPTYSTAIPNLSFNRTATAYGTIVILGNSGGNTPISHLENTFNTRGISLGYNAGLSAGGTASYSLLFSKPMKNSNYCVILSSEKETGVENEIVSTDAPEWEWCIPYIRGQKTVDGFTVEVARPADTVENSVPWRTEPTMYKNGRTERIHYMVFGGATYGTE